MIEGPIVQDQVFVHVRTGTHYIVISGDSDGDRDIKTLGKHDGGWTKCIVYYDPMVSDHMLVRYESDFRDKFERVSS